MHCLIYRDDPDGTDLYGFACVARRHTHGELLDADGELVAPLYLWQSTPTPPVCACETEASPAGSATLVETLKYTAPEDFAWVPPREVSDDAPWHGKVGGTYRYVWGA